MLRASTGDPACLRNMDFLKPPNLSQWQRMVLLLVIYTIVLVTATWLAYGMRFDFFVPVQHQSEIGRIWVWVWAVKLLALALAGQFSSLLSFFSLPDLRRLGLALGVVTVGMFGSWYALDTMEGMPRGVILLDGILCFLGLAMCRLGFRLIREASGNGGQTKSDRRVGIVGAGEVGAALARELQTKATMEPVIFFDDSGRKKRTQVHGIPVTGAVEALLEPNDFELDEVIIAMPSAPGERVREIVDLMEALEIRCRTVPAMSQIALGEIVTSLRPVEIGDVLGREQVNLELDKLGGFFAGKTVIVTGAGGSIGSELCRLLAGLDLSGLVLVDRSEFGLFEIESELKGMATVIPELVDVQDERAMAAVLARHDPAIIFHAAALKHVTLMERQPAVAVRNNVWSTHQLAGLAAQQGVGHFVLISTDKAVDPSSVMGATKLWAERLVQGHAQDGGPTRFITVRFGNVLGSSGSVVPIFQRQIEMGGPVTVTHAEATRFFMSIPEAAGLVLHSAALGENGDRFILDMGEPVSIVRLAEEMIRLSGKTVDRDISIQFIGLTSGEKLHEKLHAAEEQLSDTAHFKIKRIEGTGLSAEQWGAATGALDEIDGLDDESARAWLRKTLPDYQPE
jgi:FlaA1/EpsC-like NDP-sugar epimerase